MRFRSAKRGNVPRCPARGTPAAGYRREDRSILRIVDSDCSLSTRRVYSRVVAAFHAVPRARRQHDQNPSNKIKQGRQPRITRIPSQSQLTAGRVASARPRTARRTSEEIARSFGWRLRIAGAFIHHFPKFAKLFYPIILHNIPALECASRPPSCGTVRL